MKKASLSGAKSGNNSRRWHRVIVACIGLGSLLFWLGFSRFAAPPITPVTATVRIDNRCELVDDAFMVVSGPDNQRAFFNNGVAVLQTRSDARIKIRASGQYPGFHFESSEHKVASDLTIVVQCGVGTRTEQTLESMRQQFRQR